MAAVICGGGGLQSGAIFFTCFKGAESISGRRLPQCPGFGPGSGAKLRRPDPSLAPNPARKGGLDLDPNWGQVSGVSPQNQAPRRAKNPRPFSVHRPELVPFWSFGPQTFAIGFPNICYALSPISHAEDCTAQRSENSPQCKYLAHPPLCPLIFAATYINYKTST